MSVQPYAAVLDGSVAHQCTGPYVGVARIGMVGGGHDEGTVALLHQSHLTRERTAGERMGIGDGGDVAAVAAALGP